MPPIRPALLALVAAGALSCNPPQQQQNTPLDLAVPEDNLRAFVKVRGSLDPNEEVLYYWTGSIYSFVPESRLPLQQSNKLLFKFEGFNVARFVKAEDGYQMLSREAAFYEDPATGSIIECWNNPLNGKRVSVLQVWNDPVNNAFPASEWKPLPYSEAEGRVALNSDILLAYPSPLTVAQYPQYSAGDLYQASELFNFYAQRASLEDTQASAPADVSWTRMGPWLPWMQMGQAPGYLIYQARGHKLTGGWQQLPQHLRDYVQQRKPEYQYAPTEWPAGQRNATSWRYFKQLMDSGQYSPTCP